MVYGGELGDYICARRLSHRRLAGTLLKLGRAIYRPAIGGTHYIPLLYGADQLSYAVVGIAVSLRSMSDIHNSTTLCHQL